MTWNGTVSPIITAVVNVPLTAGQVNSTSVTYTWPTPFANTPVVSADSVVNSVIEARVLAVSNTSITLQTFWSDQGTGHSAAPTIPVHVIAIAA